ncbi:hypothetical protein PRIPAC_89394, partial [Pristionchus pacificus]|uniref:Uncharacterized protein n=1 Tax=Pristionchus pacificus TaxID=54126 RepID=A0A2A6CXY6_PRIPA
MYMANLWNTEESRRTKGALGLAGGGKGRVGGMDERPQRWHAKILQPTKLPARLGALVTRPLLEHLRLVGEPAEIKDQVQQRSKIRELSALAQSRIKEWMNESLTRVPNNRSDEHAPRVQQHGQRHEEERVDYAHLKMMRKKQAEERHAHMADTDIHRGIVCVSISTVEMGCRAAAGSFTGSVAAPPTDHHRSNDGMGNWSSTLLDLHNLSSVREDERVCGVERRRG